MESHDLTIQVLTKFLLFKKKKCLQRQMPMGSSAMIYFARNAGLTKACMEKIEEII